MQVKVEKSSELQRKLTVTVPSSQLKEKIEAKLREIGKKVTIKGFRPGRIPPKVLRQRYGKSVQQEVVSELVQNSLYEAIEKESFKPASNPVLEALPDLEADGDLEFTASIEVYPEIEAIDASTLELKQPAAEVAESDVDEMLKTLQTQRQTWTDVTRKPAAGDQVVIEYVAEAAQGARVPEQGRQRLSWVIGSSGFDDLEKAVTSLSPGKSKKLKLTFPETYGEKLLAGNEAEVELELLEVQQAELPEIDADFIRSFSIESGEMDDLRREVRGNLERELDQASKSFLKTQLVNSLLARYADLEVPAAIVHQESENLKSRALQGRDIDADSVSLDLFKDAATQRVRSGLLLAELARQNHIMIDGARVRKAVETVAETYEQPREVVQMYYGNPQLLQSVENMVLEEQVVDWALENAKVSDRKMAFKEVISAAANQGQEQQA